MERVWNEGKDFGGQKDWKSQRTREFDVKVLEATSTKPHQDGC